MGLDASHGCWHGAYSAFTRWRNTLAEAAGYRIIAMADDGRKFPSREIANAAGVYGLWDTADIDWDRFEDKNFRGEWDVPPEDPLLVLIVHSDCDGKIPAKLAPFLADRIEQLLPKLPTEPDAGHIGDWQDKTKAFIVGLREAAEVGEDVEFW